MSARRYTAMHEGTKLFPPFRLDTVNECLWRHRDDGEDARICLTPTSYSMLRYLLEHAGRLVSHYELLEALWPNTYVQPEVLKSHILGLRRALGDDAKNPRFIETLQRRGYRFIAAVQDAPAPAASKLNNSGVGQTSRKLVGREDLLEDLSNCLRRCLTSQNQVIFVTGETGTGKTTLVDEFVERVSAGFPDVRIARGQCVEGFGGKEPYYPMLEALSRLLSGSGSETVVRTLTAHAPTWLVQFPALVERGQRETLQPEIAGGTRERMLREITEALGALSLERPMLLVLENLHWVDPSTVDFISAFARRRAPGKLMLIGTHRSTDAANNGHPLKAVKQELLVHKMCREITLHPLTEAEVAEYLALDSQGADAPAELLELIYTRCEGNPLFMSITLDHLQEQGVIAVQNGTWKICRRLDTLPLQIPANLRQMIDLQIERLSAEEQQALETATADSVSNVPADGPGVTVNQEHLENLYEDLSRRIHILRRAGSRCRPDGVVPQTYEFPHALHREVFLQPSGFSEACMAATP
ncbi:MAG TPA: AAA family ATPase [Silvibacterium sp.]|nr:AAA family ATPase [Silvibacterium sp.]